MNSGKQSTLYETDRIIMTNRQIALEYLRCFCACDFESMEPLMAPDLRFTGTLHTYHSRKDYLDSLKSDAPERCRYKLISVTEDRDSVALFYEYHKPNRIMHIAQLFRFRNQKIHEVLLIFDGRGFDA